MNHERDAARLDGNSAAGQLSEIFACDVTSARATCVYCGARGCIGELMLYDAEMGPVLRCPECDAVVLRVTRTPTHIWLDATGARSIAIAIE